MARRGRNTPCIGLAITFLMLVMSPAAEASGSAHVRLVNARGGGLATLDVSVGGQRAAVGSGVAYGQAGAVASVPAGQARLSVAGSSATEQLADGESYTVVALPRNGIQVLRNGSAS